MLKRFESPALKLVCIDGGRGPNESPWHSHAEGELYVIEQGLMAVNSGSGWWIMPPGRIGWIPPNCLHSGRNRESIRGTILYFNVRLSASLPREPAVFCLSEFSTALVRQFRGTFTRSFPEARRKRLLQVLLDELTDAEKEPLHLPMPKDPQLVRMAQAIFRDASDRRTLNEWADKIGMSRRTLMRRMVSETGLSFHQWRTLARLMSAVHLLAEGSSVTTTALSSGFDSVSAFIASFRAHFGVTPARHLQQPSDASLHP